MHKFTIFFLMTTNMTSLLVISMDVHVSILSKCWQVLWVPMGRMCNVNMFITSWRRLCYVGSQKSEFITACGVGMKSNVC